MNMENYSLYQSSYMSPELESQLVIHQDMVNENDLIDMYLNQQVFYHTSLQRCSPQNSIQPENYQQKSDIPEPQPQKKIDHQQSPAKQRKSSFHNFQKHLITIIKKYITITKNKVSYCENGSIAYELWQAFMKTTSANKRLLHVIFGVQDDKSHKVGFQSLSAEFSEFARMRSKYGNERVCAAQKILRDNVVDQATHLSKFLLHANSNITKFDDFYAYYLAFLSEIKVGPLSKRMKKSSKETLVKTLKQDQ